VIEDRAQELAQLHFEHAPREEPSSNGHKLAAPASRTDEEVIEKVRAERGGKFERLFGGDLSDYGGAHSAADDGFVHKLWSYTQDSEQVKRIHAMSSLHRPDKSGRRLDYLDRSIRRAAKNVTWFYEWSDEGVITIGRNGHKKSSSSFPLRSSDDDDDFATPCKAVPFCEMGEPMEHREILAGLVPEKYPTVWYGDGGSAKSMLALSFGVAVAGGARTWLGRAVSTAPVLYADFELDTEEQNRRVRRIVKGAGLSRPPVDLLYLPALGYGPVEALRAAYAECSRRGVKLLIMDLFGPAMQGDSEAARDIIGFFGKVMEPFRASGVAVLIIDHQARTQAGERYQNKSAFGSVYKTNLTRSVVQIEATERGEDYLCLRLRQKKHNFGALSDPFGARITFGDSVVVEGQELDEADLAEEGTLNSTDRVKLALRDEAAYPDELAERTGLALGTVRNALTKLRRTAEVAATGEKRPGGQEQVTLSAKSSSSSLLLRGSDGDDDCVTACNSLSADVIGVETRRSKSGPALALGTYLEKPTKQHLEWLTCAVLKARGMDTGTWKQHAEAVKEAAGDSKNHSLDCECRACL